MRRRRGLLCLLSTLLLAAVLAPPTAASADAGVPDGSVAAAAGAGPAFGSQFHGMWSSYSDAERAKALDTLVAHGVEWVRIDVSWAMLEPKVRGQQDAWGVGFVDRVVKMATDRGLKPLAMLWMTPAWANGGAGERALPTDVQDYAAAARWAAERWRGQVAAWEVWNEPNDDHFMRGADAAAYARLLRAAYPAIKAGDPETDVVFGGPMYNDVAWITAAYDAGAGGHFDVMATHPYMGVADAEPERYDGTKWTLRHARAVHELMRARGDGGKPIWFTEFGWSSHPTAAGTANWARGVTLQQQADYLVRTLDLVAREMPYVTNVFWYNERDRTDGDLHLNSYGLMTPDLRPKPVLEALRLRRGASGVQTPPAPPAEPALPAFRVVACPTEAPVTDTAVTLCEPKTYVR